MASAEILSGWAQIITALGVLITGLASIALQFYNSARREQIERENRARETVKDIKDTIRDAKQDILIAGIPKTGDDK